MQTHAAEINSHQAPKTKGRPRDSTQAYDVEFGSRVRLARTIAGMSQSALGAKIGLTFQQVQKYERGANRVTVGRLVDIAKATGQALDFFLGDTQAGEHGLGSRPRLMLEMMSNIAKLPAKHQLAIAQFVHTLTR